EMRESRCHSERLSLRRGRRSYLFIGPIHHQERGATTTMPIKVPDHLPAKDILTSENIFVMDESRAFKQDIRPLRIVILNLMPTKETTETQLLRLLGNTPLQV